MHVVRTRETKNQALDWVGEGTVELRDGNENELSQIINVWHLEPLFEIYFLLMNIKTWDQNEVNRNRADLEPEPEVVREQAESSRILDASLSVPSEMLQGLHKLQGTFCQEVGLPAQELV